MCLILPAFDDLRTEMVLNCLLNAPLSIMAILGNTIVLMAIWRTPALRTPSHILFVNLAVSDLGVGLLVQPFYIAYKSAQIQGIRRLFCVSGFIFNFLSPFLMAVTLLTLVTISLDRFLAVYLHLRYRQVVTTKRLALVLGLLWLCSALYASTMYWALKSHRVLSITMISCSLVVTFIMYFKILQVVCRHQRQMQKQAVFTQERRQGAGGATARIARFKKTVSGSLYVFALLLLCYIPLLCARIASAMADPRDASSVYLALNFSSTVVYVNSALNPLVYCWRIREIRLAVLKTAKMLLGGENGPHLERVTDDCNVVRQARNNPLRRAHANLLRKLSRLKNLSKS